MLLRLVCLVALASTLHAAPGYAPHPAPHGGSRYHHQSTATVTSYNRRGSTASADTYAGNNKPAIYGSSYNSAPYNGPPPPSSYAPAPAAYAAPAPAPASGYGGYGPQTNAYSAQSQQLSHDPEYDAAKDPVSQYAAYLPVKEYGNGGKYVSNGNELSLYGYRK